MDSVPPVPGYDQNEEVDDDDQYVMYKDRSEWSDILPISQDEGDEPVVQIEYSPKFKDVYDYFRGALQHGEKSERVLTLTSDAIMLNAANYTVWQYRRDVLEALGVPSVMTESGLGKEFEKEFEFSRQMIEENQKNYQVWHHRKSLVSWAAGYQDDTEEILLKCDVARTTLARLELDLTEKILQTDAKNYHAWQHRQWVLSTFNMFNEELDYVTDLIKDDVRNNSAWNERYFVLSNSPDLSKENLELEVAFTWTQLVLAMSNESPWNYMKGLLLLYKRLQDESALANVKATLLQQTLSHYKNGCRHVPLLGFMTELVLDQLNSKSCSDKIYEQALEICDTLQEKDTIRRHYWDHVKKELQNKHDQTNKQESASGSGS